MLSNIKKEQIKHTKSVLFAPFIFIISVFCCVPYRMIVASRSGPTDTMLMGVSVAFSMYAM